MAGPPVTEAQVAALLAVALAIDQPVEWRGKRNDVWVEASLRVRHPERRVGLEVRITANLLAREKFSIVLLLSGEHRIRAVDFGSSHANYHTDGNRWVHETHEHVWTDICRDSWARSAIDFPALLEDAFRAFCAGSGINFTGRWQDLPPIQLGMDDP